MYSSSADCGAGAAGSAARGVRGEEGAGSRRGPEAVGTGQAAGGGMGGGVGACLVALLHHLEPDLHAGAVSESVAAAAAAAAQVAAQQAVLRGAARQTMTLPGLRFWSPPHNICLEKVVVRLCRRDSHARGQGDPTACLADEPQQREAPGRAGSVEQRSAENQGQARVSALRGPRGKKPCCDAPQERPRRTTRARRAAAPHRSL